MTQAASPSPRSGPGTGFKVAGRAEWTSATGPGPREIAPHSAKGASAGLPAGSLRALQGAPTGPEWPAGRLYPSVSRTHPAGIRVNAEQNARGGSRANLKSEVSLRNPGLGWDSGGGGAAPADTAWVGCWLRRWTASAAALRSCSFPAQRALSLRGKSRW